MGQRGWPIRVGFSLGGGLALLAVLAHPGIAQQGSGGREARFSLNQGIESIRNPELSSDREDETRLVSNTDLSYALSSTTRRASAQISLGVRLRGAWGDLDTGEEEGFEIDRPRLAFEHSYTAPGAEFETTASVQRFNVGFLERLELIENDDGTVEVPEDIDDLEGTGFRTNTRLGFSARFGENRPFGWGVTLRNSALTYDDVEGSSLEDSSRTNMGINARFDLNPVLTLRAQADYELRTQETGDAEDTVTYNLVLTRERGENGAVRAGVSLAQPEGRSERFTVFVGGTQEIDDRRALDFNLGTTIGEDGDSRLVSRINYREALTPTLNISARLNREEGDTNDNETVLDTAARLNLSKTLTPLSSVSFGLLYGERENFSTDETTTDMSVSVSYVHNLTPDWALSVGASHTWQDEADSSSTTSDRLFFNIGRSWNSRF